MALWSTTDKFDHQLNGYPISRDGALVAIAVYSGGTEPARKNAELLVRALNIVEHMGGAPTPAERQTPEIGE